MSLETRVVRAAAGAYEGPVRDGVAAFKGIPYALAPVGARRFQAPQPVPVPEGVRACFEFGPTAPKAPYPSPIDTLLAEPVIDGDDCLNLNVWTPVSGLPASTNTTENNLADQSAAVELSSSKSSENQGLPVLVWIHGGAFAHGSGAVPTTDGSRFARDGVVCVTLNYRLGALGFLLLDGAPANRGLLDQVAALEWVRDNIAAFGGDPQRVTVAGESAGAMSIGTLLAMPRAQGLFQQAVTQSGAAAHVITGPISRKVTAGLAASLEIEPTLAAFEAIETPDLIVAQEKFIAAVGVERNPQKWGELARNTMPFEPTIDGDVLPGDPLELIRAGSGAGVRLLTGTNRDEMTLFLAPTGLLANANDAILTMTAGVYGLPPDRLAVYRQESPEATAGELMVDVVSDWFFRIPVLRLAEARATGAPTFVYEFDWRTPVWDGLLRATHGLEVGFVFDTLDDPDGAVFLGPNPPQKLADQVHNAWVTFVSSGDPGWAAYGEDRAVMVFGTDGGVQLDPRGTVRAVWDGLR
jgi:para-nitrobenzyl esterase